MCRHFVWDDWWSFLRWANVVESTQGPGGLYVGCYLTLQSSLSLTTSWPSLLPHCRVRGGSPGWREGQGLGEAWWWGVGSGPSCAWILSRVPLLVTPWAVARQAPLSRKFSRQEYWSGLPFPTPGDLPDPEIEPTSSTSPALVGGFFCFCVCVFFFFFFTIEPPGNHYSATKKRWKFNDLFSIHDRQGPTV